MKTFTTSREIAALPENIFATFFNSERLAKWWGPAGFSNTFNKFQFIPGGKWSFVMHGPEGRNYPNESEFIELGSDEKVVIRHLSQPYLTLTISITGLGNVSLVLWNQKFDSKEVAKKRCTYCNPIQQAKFRPTYFRSL